MSLNLIYIYIYIASQSNHPCEKVLFAEEVESKPKNISTFQHSENNIIRNEKQHVVDFTYLNYSVGPLSNKSSSDPTFDNNLSTLSRLPTCSNLQIEKTYLNTNGLFEPINNTQYYLSPPSDIFHSNEPSPNQNLNNFVNHRLVNVK